MNTEEKKYIFKGKLYEQDGSGNNTKIITSAAATAVTGANVNVTVSVNDNGVATFAFTVPTNAATSVADEGDLDFGELVDAS